MQILLKISYGTYHYESFHIYHNNDYIDNNILIYDTECFTCIAYVQKISINDCVCIISPKIIMYV